MNSQPPEKQQAMHLCFENLMEGIERNLLTKNRDRSVRGAAQSPGGVGDGRRTPSLTLCLSLRFTQNLSAFRREVNDSMKNSTYGVNSNDMMS
mgnify:CR=1 FL=1